jgi:hypothetical protein
LPLARNSQTLLPGVRANDALPREEEDYNVPTESAQGKKSNAFSLMQPQEVARRLLPGPMFQTLQAFAKGVPSDCGPPWSTEVIAAARHTGPHVSALTEENIQLIWDDVEYQQQAGFVRVVTESILFGAGQNSALKISRVAVVPQTNRRGRIIVNLSAQVELPPEREKNQRRKRKRHHPSVNETTVPAADQTAVAALGSALPAILLFMFDTDCEWEIDWQKIDLSDGFWRIIVEDGQEFNFVYQLPRRPGDTETHYVVPSSLHLGWMNSPAYFCTATESARLLSKRMLALTFPTGIDVAHRHKHYCVPKPANSNEGVVSAESSGSIVPATKSSAATDAVAWKKPRDMALLSTVFVDDFMKWFANDVGQHPFLTRLQGTDQHLERSNLFLAFACALQNGEYHNGRRASGSQITETLRWCAQCVVDRGFADPRRANQGQHNLTARSPHITKNAKESTRLPSRSRHYQTPPSDGLPQPS